MALTAQIPASTAEVTSHKRKYKAEKEARAKIQQPRLQCEYLLPHKQNRRCNMTRKVNEKFCAQHLSVCSIDFVQVYVGAELILWITIADR